MKPLRKHLLFLALFFAALSYLTAAQAQPTESLLRHSNQQVSVRFISERSALTPGEKFLVGFEFTIAPEWHIYWKNPGDSGTRPQAHWKLPEGWSASDFLWPTPEVLPLGPLANFGYSGRTILPVEIAVSATAPLGNATALTAELSWLVCKEDCIPQKATFVMPLTVGNESTASPDATVLQNARATLPHTNHSLTGELYYPQQGSEFTVRISPAKFFIPENNPIRIFPEQLGVIEPAAAQPYKIVGDQIEITLKKGGIALKPPLDAVITVGKVGYSLRLKEGELALIEHDTATSSSSLILLVLSALLGGILLNLMPCVLPVISLKVFGLLDSTSSSPSRLKLHGLMYSAGVIGSMLALAALLLVLRQAGESIGWGFQMQSPVFVALLALLFFVMGAIFLGGIDLGSGLAGRATTLDTGDGLVGSFFSGFLSVVAATPCTAPFMGAALGSALTLPAVQSLTIFFGLGLGLALPYLLVCFLPALLSYLPKPGVWMERLKEFLAFPLFATVLWLLGVLSKQLGAIGVLISLFCMLLAGIALWILKNFATPTASNRRRRYTRSLAALLFLSSIGFLIAPHALRGSLIDTNRDMTTQAGQSDMEWITYSPEALAKLRAENRVIFLDFTAAWCLTCQVNKRVSVLSDKVQSKFKSERVALLRGDWTTQDPIITEALQKFGRASVPLNVVYGPGSPDGELLPALLTPGIIVEAIDRAKGPTP